MRALHENSWKKIAWRRPSPKVLLIAGVMAVITCAALAGALVWHATSAPRDPAAENQATIARLQKDIGAVLLLPSDETPTVARLQNVTELNKQEFYASAQAGDYVLTYPKAGLAILYREKDHKLINVDHVSFEQIKQGAPN